MTKLLLNRNDSSGFEPQLVNLDPTAVLSGAMHGINTSIEGKKYLGPNQVHLTTMQLGLSIVAADNPCWKTLYYTIQK